MFHQVPLPSVYAHLLLLVCLSAVPPASASNGFNLIAYGVEGIAMGGADIAVARDTSALNSNPAGLTQLGEQALEMTNILAHALNVRHKDGFGNDVGVVNDWIVAGQFGYARTLSDGKGSFGLGLFAQGGAGNDFGRVDTAFGTHDDLSIRLRFSRLTPGYAWRVDEDLSLGASLMLTYNDMQQELFPNTSFAAPSMPSFFGLHLRDMKGQGIGIKLGALKRLSPSLKLGLSYTSRTKLELDGGRARFDMSALGLGKVDYREVRTSGMDLPQEVGIGLAWQLDPDLLLAFDLLWLDWSNAVRRSVLSAGQPDNPAAPANLELSSDLNWRDQYVAAVGLAWNITPDHRLWAGFNLANAVCDHSSLTPLLAPLTRRHLTLGFERGHGPGWRFAAALEYQMAEKVTYTNESIPFGADAEAELESLFLHLMVALRW